MAGEGRRGVEQHVVSPADAGLRLDRWFRRHFPGLGHGALAKLMRTGQIRVDGSRVSPGDRVVAGQVIRVPPLDAAARQPPPRDRRPRTGPLGEADIAAVRRWILHMDEAVIALNKPPGLATQGGPRITRHVDGLLEALRFAPDDERPRLVHRLDRDTSGVLLVARTAVAAAALAQSFRGRDAQKLYWALVVGTPRPAAGKIVAAVEKTPGRAGERMGVSESGKPARTLYSTVDHAGRKAAWLALQPLTGRTHQLRVHCAHIGHPIVGDGKYGGREAHLTGIVSRKLHLHARRLRLPHPSGGVLDLRAPLPPHMAETWAAFGWDEDPAADAFPEPHRG
ncbi:MAG: RluA family pseudouridine synthase [Alphaproteobacteria bacterium]|nr:MAG: RluA family pseudouridine synthase [Alphaproteobacteria bacterium]